MNLGMENTKGPSSTMRNMYNGKHYSLPPKSPFPSTAPFYAQNANTSGSKGIPKHRGGNSLHQRTSSESLVIDEQPSWLDELLDEPETPVKRAHRRSSSDSFTYTEAANANIQVGQVAQRSRVRKLQYIAELERNVQTLQAEGCEVSSELKFLNRRSLILTMENKALKQQLEKLAREQLIRYLEQEVLEREIERLRALYKQQQPPPTEKPVVSHRQTNSMESQFADLSLKNKESGALCDALLGSLRI